MDNQFRKDGIRPQKPPQKPQPKKEDSNEKKLTSCPKKLKEQKSTQYN